MRSFDEIRDDFAFLDDWEDQIQYVMELGSELPPYPESERDAAHKVSGCVSQVWLETIYGQGPDPVLTFRGQSDAEIVRGLVAVVLSLYSGKRASEILALNAQEALAPLKLDEILTNRRSNGVRAVVQRIRRDAEAALAPAA